MVLAARLTNLPPTRGTRGSVHYVSWYPELTLWAIERVALRAQNSAAPTLRQLADLSMIDLLMPTHNLLRDQQI